MIARVILFLLLGAQLAFANVPKGAFPARVASIANQYDSLARLTNTALQNYWGHTLDGYGYTYGRPELRTSVVRSLGLSTNIVSVGYDNIGQLISWTANESGGATRLNEQLGYGYDPAENLHLRTNGGLIQTFNTDSLNQLSNVTRSGSFTLSGTLPAPTMGVSVNGSLAQTNSDFTFAKSGLVLANGNNTFTVTTTNAYGVTTNNVLTLNLPSSVSFLSDSNGNLTGDGTRVFLYDAENQLTNVYVTNAWRTDFLYDGLGRSRIERDYSWNENTWTLTNETRFVFDGLVPIQERNSSNTVEVSYTRGLDLSGGLAGAGGIGGLLARTDVKGSTFYHADGIGNITAIIDANENIEARYEFDPYGRIIGKWGMMADVNSMQFSSMLHHGPSRLTLYPFRAYDPTLQRWDSPDPLGETAGANRYQFVGNNPINGIDPYGLLDWSLWHNPLLLFQFSLYPQAVEGIVMGDPKPITFGPDSHIALLNEEGAGITPLQDEDGNDIDPGDLLWNTLFSAGVDVAILPLGGPEEEGATVAVTDAARAAKNGIKCQNGTVVKGFAKHAIDRAIGDTAERAGTKPQAILDALKNPKKIITGVDQQGRPFERFYGRDARVVVNPRTGQIVSVNPLTGAGAQ